MPYAIEDCIPATATKTGLFAIDVWIDSSTAPSNPSHWIGLELLKNSVGADYQTTGIAIILHYDGSIEALGGLVGIDSAKIDTDFIPTASVLSKIDYSNIDSASIVATSNTFVTHWGAGMTKVTIHMVGNLVNVYVDNTLTLSFATTQTGGFHSLAKYGGLDAYFDTFIIRSYVEPNPDQTTWGPEEVYFVTHEEPYDTDIILKALGLTKQYDVSVILEALILKDYDISVILKKLGLTSTYDTDVLFKALGITKLYIADLIIKRLGIEIPYDLNVIFERIEIEKTYDIDVILEKVNVTVTKDYVIDAIIKGLGITKNMTVDAIFKRLGIIKTETIDVLFKRLGIEKTDSIDMIFKKLSISLSYDISVIFNQNIPTKHISYMLDLILIAAITALGGGHPEEIDRPTFKIEYIDKTYNIRVKPLRIVRQHKQTFETKELNHAFKSGTKISCSRLNIPKVQTLNIPAKQLNMVMKKNYDISMAELAILINYLSSISTLPLQIPLSVISSFNILPLKIPIKKGTEIDTLPLFTVKINSIIIPISRLNLIFEDSISAAVMPLSTRKKRMTKRQLLKLLDDLDELDE